MKNLWIRTAVLLAILLLVNWVTSLWSYRVDLTEDQRYTLSEPALQTVERFEQPVVIDVLLQGELPPEFARLQAEAEQTLNSFSAANPLVKINFVDPMEGSENPQETMAGLQQLGLTPVNVTVEESGKRSQELVFPWALVNHGDQTVRVQLLKNKLGADTEERINNSVQNLEYAFADAFTKLNVRDRKKVAVIKGNGQLPDILMADYLTSIRDYYNIGAITLDSVANSPEATLEQLRSYDLAVIAKPTQAFTEAEKYVLDQYLVSGGRSIWLVDPVAMELDSLFNQEGRAIATARDLNLDDLFFRYGFRINPALVKDLYFSQIVLASGEGNASQYEPVPWYYHPMVFSANDHPVNTNTEALRMQFASPIDTLGGNGLRKTVLYSSSPLSRPVNVPQMISLEEINTPPDRSRFTQGGLPLAVLVEGAFSSAYKNRIKPLQLTNAMESGPENKLLVIGDGDLIANQLRNGRPLELGYDKWTNNYYGNKEFLVNATNFLLDDTGLINIRARKIEIPLLDPESVLNQKFKWQALNILIPVILIAVLGVSFNGWRKHKYRH